MLLWRPCRWRQNYLVTPKKCFLQFSFFVSPVYLISNTFESYLLLYCIRYLFYVTVLVLPILISPNDKIFKFKFGLKCCFFIAQRINKCRSSGEKSKQFRLRITAKKNTKTRLKREAVKCYVQNINLQYKQRWV